MKKFHFLSVMLFAMCIFCSSAYSVPSAQSPDTQKNNWLLGVIFKLENMRDKAMSDIRKYDDEIRKCDNTLIQADKMMRNARQNGNAKTLAIANKASQTAKEAKTKNQEKRNAAEFDRKRAEYALASVRNSLSDAQGYPRKIKSMITSYSGDVVIKKKNGERFTYRANQKGFLEVGDEISTDNNSQVELQFLDGRGTMNVGEYSRVKMEEDNADTQAVSMFQGKASFSIEKLDDYQKMLDEKMKNSANNMKAQLRKKYEVRTPSAVCGVRGTQFVVYEDAKKGTEVVVLEGSVEVKSKNENKTAVINEGYRASVAKDGKLSEPEKIDLSELDRWWEK